jgi:hypothetical protein
MDGHRLAEKRSLLLHRTVAARLRDDPEALEAVRARVAEWLRTGAVHVEYAGAWDEILARPLSQVCDAIVRDDERTRALRQSTPFAGILDARSRWAVWRAAGRHV